MASFESPGFNFGINPEKLKEDTEDGVDLRNENEIFRDHERLELNDQEDDQSVLTEKDNLADEKDGVLYVTVPTYKYDTSLNPFIGMGPHTIRLYSVARYLDVMFLHKFMYGNILVRGLRSADYVPAYQRAKFIKNIQQTGDVPIANIDDQTDALKALRFAPYAASDSTMPLFELYHKSDQYSGDRPHNPVDVWLVHDINAYRKLDEEDSYGLANYRIDESYDRQSSLLAVAVIN